MNSQKSETGRSDLFFREFNLISNLTAIENVELPLVYRGVDRKTRHKLAVESLTMVGLEKRMDHRPNEMSGGQQRGGYCKSNRGPATGDPGR